MVGLQRESEQRRTSSVWLLLWHSKLKQPLEKDYIDSENLLNSGSCKEQATGKVRMYNVPPTGTENSVCLPAVW